MKKFDLKKLAKGMSVKDKAKILCIDYQQKYGPTETALLTSDEEDAIWKDAEKKNELRELNRLIDLFNLTNRLVSATHKKTMFFQSFVSNIHILVLYIFLKQNTNDKLDAIKCHVSSKKIGKIIDDEKYPDMDFTSWFSPNDDEENAEPNVYMQKLFIRAYQANKLLRQELHMIKYVEGKADMSFLSEIDKEIVGDAEKALEEFAQREGFLMILNIYKTSYESGLIQKKDYTEQLFVQLMTDTENMVLLTEEEKKEAEDIVEKALKTY